MDLCTYPTVCSITSITTLKCRISYLKNSLFFFVIHPIVTLGNAMDVAQDYYSIGRSINNKQNQ